MSNSFVVRHANRLTHYFIVFLYIMIALELCVLGFFLYVSAHPEVEETLSLATSMQPETFTELYFENHRKLPQRVSSSRLYSFSFTLHNQEKKDMVYDYEVYLEHGTQKYLLDRNNVMVGRDKYETITSEFAMNGDIPKSRVVVSLISKNQQIAFWIIGANYEEKI